MLVRPKVKCVFVGDGPMVHNWAQSQNNPNSGKPANSETPTSRMRILLQDQTVLVFDSAQRFAQRSFNRNLRTSLEDVSSEPC
jgi:hypothetical protein